MVAVFMDTHFLAWNGLSCTRPTGWELTALGRQHLQLATNGKSMLDMRWNRICGRFSFEAHLRKLAKVYGKKHKGLSITNEHTRWDLPQGIVARSFEWGASGQSSKGAILYHAPSSTAILAQSSGPPERFTSFLSSLRCHLTERSVPWAVYDLRALTPSGFRLDEYAFQPGRYRLALHFSKQRLILHRLAPADVLLSGRNLTLWSRDRFAATIRRCRLMMEDTGEADSVIWRRPLMPGRFAGAMALLLNRPLHAYIRVWRPARTNRLLGVELQGSRPFDGDTIQQVISAYATI